jgi:hypothetical protein
MGREVKIVMTCSMVVLVLRECDAVYCCRLAASYWSNVLPLFAFFHTELWSKTLLPIYKLCMLKSSQLSLSFPLCISLLPHMCHIPPPNTNHEASHHALSSPVTSSPVSQCWAQLLYSKVCQSPQCCMLYNLFCLHRSVYPSVWIIQSAVRGKNYAKVFLQLGCLCLWSECHLQYLCVLCVAVPWINL